MALTATMYRLKVQLSDSDRGVYTELDLRLAQHPSETAPYLITRVLAYCMHYEEGIAFSRGLANAEEPAVWVKQLDGRITTWIEVGTPAGDRLHRASKACERVIVYTQHDPALLVREVQRTHIHKLDAIEAFAPDRALIRDLGERLERKQQWDLSRAGGQLYVNVGGQTFEGPLTPVSLVSS